MLDEQLALEVTCARHSFRTPDQLLWTLRDSTLCKHRQSGATSPTTSLQEIPMNASTLPRCLPSRRALPMLVAAALALGASTDAAAHPRHSGGLATTTQPAVHADFDIVHTKISIEGRTARFHMAVSGRAGATRPTSTGKLAGSQVFAYVWPTALDPSLVGFEPGSGVLALAVTAHPDFDDTPLFDENGDGDPDNDGDVWHSHWVVLGPTAACGDGALAVIDIPEGSTPQLPKTWPGLPILIDSPGWQPIFSGDSVEVRVAFDDIEPLRATGFDGVTAGLRINANVHAPLLCVEDVFKIASGDLSLPGRVDPHGARP
jgi:hypothetical protein